MREDLTVLGLLFENSGVDATIESKEDRIVLQKTVYLSQIAGVDLGYRYSWYINGPYSPSLTKDYYELLENSDLSEVTEQWELGKNTEGQLTPVRDLVANKPAGESLADWLEVLSSIHYLKVVSSQDDQALRGMIEKEKPHLMGLVEAGEEQLRTAGFI